MIGVVGVPGSMYTGEGGVEMIGVVGVGVTGPRIGDGGVVGV